MPSEPADPENRELCPDGRCVGLIGADGRCGECGISREETPDDGASQPDELAAIADDGEGHGDDANADADDASPEVDSRVLCPDDTCVGIIAVDGRCGTCGRAG